MKNDLSDLPLQPDSERHFQELFQNDVEIIRAVDELRLALNNQAEALARAVYILDVFVPKPLMEKANAEYEAVRIAQIPTSDADPN